MKRYLTLIIFLAGLISCSKDELSGSDECKLLGVTLANVDEYHITIDEAASKVEVEVKSGTAVSALKINFQVSDKASVSPVSGSTLNLSTPKTITVTSETGKTFSYRMSAKFYDVPQLIQSVSIPALSLSGTNALSDNTITFVVPEGTDVTTLVMEATLAQGAAATPSFGIPTDFTKPVQYKVKDSRGYSRTYTATVSVAQRKDEVRGVWLADPRFTAVMKSYQGVVDFVNLLDELNMNTIYVSVWTQEKTLYKSQVLKSNTNYASVEDGWMLKGVSYASTTNDPIKDLISLAHAKNMKVIFWYEYGFMRSGNASTDKTTHPILSVHPDWDGVGSNGAPANYNNSDFYLNSFDPAVQEFMIQLMEEAITLYPDVDGIQGDDRLPASPMNSGYNTVTREQYRAEKGVYPPTSSTDPTWKRWRLDNLNAFGREMYRRIKAKRSNLIVCFSPNPYPWCEDALMQEWPQWIRDGIVDILSVQCYRTDEYSYRQTIQQVQSYTKPNTSKNIFNPGIYLRSNDAGWDTFFRKQMNINREFNTNGETFFYNEGLKLDVNKRVIKLYYPTKASFPQL